MKAIKFDGVSFDKDHAASMSEQEFREMMDSREYAHLWKDDQKRAEKVAELYSRSVPKEVRNTEALIENEAAKKNNKK